MPNTKNPSLKLSPETVQALAKLTPMERDKALMVAAKLLAIRAKREAQADGKTIDLTRGHCPGNPSKT